MIPELGSEQAFKAFAAEYGTVVILYGAEWCSPCATARVELSVCATDRESVMGFAYISVDNFCPAEVKSVPTIIRYDDGKFHSKATGAKRHKHYSEVLDLWNRTKELESNDPEDPGFSAGRTHRTDITKYR